MSLPTQKVLVRDDKAVSLFVARPGEKPVLLQGKLSVPSGQATAWSPDGALLAVIQPSGVVVYDAETEKEVGRLDLQGVIRTSFSPLGKLLLTFQKPAADKGNADKNLKLWEWRKKEAALQLHQKQYSKDTWPPLHVQGDESSAFHKVGATVNIYDLGDTSAGVKAKLAVKGLGGFAVSPAPESPIIAAWVPEMKSTPGFLGLWRITDLTKAPESSPPFARRSFFRATEMQLRWNSKGTAVLGLSFALTDSSNQSYYGEQKLYFMSADGNTDCLVRLPKEGPVFDAQWSPKGDAFVAVAGAVPPQITLFSEKCDAICDLGSGGFNMARWSPQGRLIALAGFGAMPGDVAFFERTGEKKCTQIGQKARVANGSTAEWSPDGKLLLVATLSPRMQVDNSIRIVRPTGELAETKEYNILLDASWRPAPDGTFPDEAPSGGAAGAAAPAAPKKKQADVGYVPPQLRAQASAGRFAGPPVRSLPPGAEPPEVKAPSKNARRRKKKTGKADGAEHDEDDGEAAVTAGIADVAIGGGPAQTGNEVTSSTGNDAASSTGNGAGAEGGGSEEREKRVRNLQKKLRQIKELEDKRASGASLEPEQVAKIAGKEALQAEIRALEAGE